MAVQLFDDLFSALRNDVGSWNRDIPPNSPHILGIEELRTVGQDHANRMILINHPGASPGAAIFLGHLSIMVAYFYRQGFEIRYAWDDQQQTGSLHMEGREWAVEEVSGRILAPIFEELGGN